MANKLFGYKHTTLHGYYLTMNSCCYIYMITVSILGYIYIYQHCHYYTQQDHENKRKYRKNQQGKKKTNQTICLVCASLPATGTLLTGYIDQVPLPGELICDAGAPFWSDGIIWCSNRRIIAMKPTTVINTRTARRNTRIPRDRTTQSIRRRRGFAALGLPTGNRLALDPNVNAAPKP